MTDYTRIYTGDDGQHALMMGDVAVHPAQLTNIDWSLFSRLTRNKQFGPVRRYSTGWRPRTPWWWPVISRSWASVTWFGKRGGGTGRGFRC